MLTGVRRKWGVAALLLAIGGSPASAQQAPVAPPALLSPEAAKSCMPIATSYRLVGAAAPKAGPPARSAEGLPPPKVESVPAPGVAVAPATPAAPWLVLAEPPPGNQVPGRAAEDVVDEGDALHLLHEAPHGGLLGLLGVLPAGAAAPGPARPRSFWERSRYRMQDCFLGFPEYFNEPPLGHSVYAHYKTHVANGDAARMVLYHYDFVDGSDVLNPRGRERLGEIAAMLPKNFFPVVIEPDCAPGLDEARRLGVLTELGRCSFPIPTERVVIGKPPALGLRGAEAVVIYRNLLRQTQQRGAGTGGGGGISTGATPTQPSATLGGGTGISPTGIPGGP
jgi:hypothetical protein